jgi:hypothetical protein
MLGPLAALYEHVKTLAEWAVEVDAPLPTELADADFGRRTLVCWTGSLPLCRANAVLPDASFDEVRVSRSAVQ